MRPLASDIIKTYPSRGPMQQFRLTELTAFHCFRCGQSKKSRLLVVYADDWNRLLCNGCYGRLLSIFQIKSGTKSADEKAAELANVLLTLHSKDQINEAERRYRLAETRAETLSRNSMRFIATAEFVSHALLSASELDWSAATIGLCKAVEIEVVERIMRPLAAQLRGVSLDADKNDKDIGRVARFLSQPDLLPPELGTFSYFLQTSLNSETRRTTSPSIRGLHRLFSLWPNSSWLTDIRGFYDSLVTLTRNFRNRAAHTDSLSDRDYQACREFVLGRDGLLWKLIFATQTHKK
jgi:hypothetical protein